MKRSKIIGASIIIVGLVVVGILSINGQPQPIEPQSREMNPKEKLSISSEPVYRNGQLAIINPDVGKAKGEKEELLRLGVLRDGKLVPVMLAGEELVPDQKAEGGEPGLLLITKISPLGVSRKGNIVAQSKGSVLGVIETNGKVLLLGAKEGNKVVSLKLQANRKLKASSGSEAGIIGDCGKPVEVLVNINNSHRPLEVNEKGAFTSETR